MTVSISTDILCPVCRRAQSRPAGEKAGHALWDCPACGVLFIREPAPTGIDGLYDAHYAAVGFAAPPTVERSLERVVRRSASFKQTGCWLDVGFGQGVLLEVAERHGWRCFGTEVSDPALARGRDRGWVVSRTAAQDSRFVEGAFDVVSAVELIEHLGEPGRFLADASRWLRPGGLLYLTTPNAASLNRRLLGLEWSVVAPPDHALLWTAKALRLALAEAGLRVRRLRAEGWNPAEVMAVVRRRPIASVDRTGAGVALSDRLGRSARGRVVKAAVNVALSALGLGDTLKVWAVRERSG